LWIVPFGYLIFGSGFLSRVLGILLMLAGAGAQDSRTVCDTARA